MVDTGNLQSRYYLDERLALGGMGTVFTATDERLHRKVAVKLLKPELAEDPRFVERFKREARAVAALSHSNIAGIYDYGIDGDRHFIVMELVDGMDLARVLRSDAPLSPERASRIAAQICSALAHAHAADIVHRDVKPGNVIIDRSDGVKVTDFGIARAIGDSTLTATGSVIGTAQYLSPEQAGGRRAGPASDIYSAGIVLYEMLTGSVPFTGDTPVAIAVRHMSEGVPRPSDLQPEVPRELDAVVARATARNPDDRYRSASEMEAELRKFAPPAGGAVIPDPAVSASTAVLDPSEATRQFDDRVGSASGRDWDTKRIGRAVLIVLAALALIAVALVAVRLLTDREEPTVGNPRREQRQQQQQPVETPEEAQASYAIESSLMGMNVKDAKEYLEGLKGMELEVIEETVESDSEKDTVVGTEPEIGSTIQPGSAVTLLVSNGEEGSDGKGEHGPSDVPPGKDKKDKEEDH
jgi:eukaryotic-like serine/threonine-protein kinase